MANKFQQPPPQQMLPSPNEAGYYQIWSLPVGAVFATSPNPFSGKPATGVLLDVMVGCVQVRINGKSERVVINTSDGESAEFNSARSKHTYWDRETPVKFLGIDQSFLNSRNENEDVQIENEHGADDMKKGSKKSANTAAAKADVANRSRKSAAASAPAPVIEPTDAQNDRALADVEGAAALKFSTPIDPKTRALQARWKMAVTQLGELLKVDGPSNLAAAARERITSIYDDAVAVQVMLPDYGLYIDPVFRGMDLGPADILGAITEGQTKPPAARGISEAGDGTGDTTGDVEGDVEGDGDYDSATQDSEPSTTHPNQEKTTNMKKSSKKSTAASNGHSASAKPTSATKAKIKTPKAASNPCLDGCGEKVSGNFKQGHDARYRSMILKVERGDMKQSDLPSLMVKSGGRDGSGLEFKKLASGSLKCVNSVLAH